MAQFLSLAPNVEVNGETVQSFLNGMGTYEQLFKNVLEENGIENLQSGKWYLQQNWLNAFKVIAEKTGPATLSVIGKRIIDSAKWPPDVDSIEKALVSIDIAYHMNHRGGDIGAYRFEKIGDRKVRMVCDNPYPCDFDLGVIKGAGQKFAQSKDKLLVRHENPDICRKNGGDTCTYVVSW